MISTGRTGRAVAVVAGGANDGVVIRLVEEKAQAETPRRPLHEVLHEADLREDARKVKLLSVAEQREIARQIAVGELVMESSSEDEDEESEPEPEPRRAPPPPTYRRVARAYLERSRYEYRLDDGKMVVLPNKEPERVFVAGASGAGKSFWTAQYIREYQEMFPDRRVYLFSTHEDEKAYKPLEHVAVPLDDAFIENPPQLDQLTNTLVVFDDCDNLQNKKLAKAIDAVNADLVANGRKYNIHVVTLNHVMMNYHKTRAQLVEANRVVFFPGSSYHDQRFLKVYVGVGAKWQQKILGEKSRWICMDMRQPRSYVTENAVVVIGSRPNP